MTLAHIRALGLLALLFGAPAYADVAIDAVTPAKGFAAGRTYTHTPIGTPTLAITCFLWNGGAGGTPAATYGGTSMPHLQTRINQGNSSLECWKLDSPAAGAQSVAVTWTGSFNYVLVTMTFTGTLTSGSTGTPVTSVGTSTTSTVAVVSGAGHLVFDALATIAASAVVTTGSGQTNRADEIQTNVTTAHGDSGTTVSSTTAHPTYTFANGSFAMMGVDIIPDTPPPTDTPVGPTNTPTNTPTPTPTVTPTPGPGKKAVMIL